MPESDTGWVEDIVLASKRLNNPPVQVDFVRLTRDKYVGEVGKSEGDYVFHFYPLENNTFPDNFEDKLGEAFIAAFKDESRLMANYVDMMDSWAVCARGYANNPLADDIALSVFNELDYLLEQ